jgi:hypothetical protein
MTTIERSPDCRVGNSSKELKRISHCSATCRTIWARTFFVTDAGETAI